MLKFFAITFLVFPLLVSAQVVEGTVRSEEGDPLSGATVINMQTGQQVLSKIDGAFSVQAAAGSELRIFKRGYERSTAVVTNPVRPLNIVLARVAEEIEEVKVAYKPVGDLKEDVKHVGDSKATAKLKAETIKYIRSKSDPAVLKPRVGEFVQPVGPGFNVGKVRNQWDKVDYMQFLLKEIGTEFFTEELKLTTTQIQPFIFYIFQNFDYATVLATARPTTADVSRFISEAYRKIEPYRRGETNQRPPKKRRWKR